jgi:hypothetical protein
MRNFESRFLSGKVSFRGDDAAKPHPHSQAVSDSEPDWHLQSWMGVRKKRQADLVKELGWAKGRANKFFHGQHPYRREIVNELAAWLEIEPWELLMEPERAEKIKRLMGAAYDVVGSKAAP